MKLRARLRLHVKRRRESKQLSGNKGMSCLEMAASRRRTSPRPRGITQGWRGWKKKNKGMADNSLSRKLWISRIFLSRGHPSRLFYFFIYFVLSISTFASPLRLTFGGGKGGYFTHLVFLFRSLCVLFFPCSLSLFPLDGNCSATFEFVGR